MSQLTAVFDSGSVTLNDVQCKWKAKGTGSKLVVRSTSFGLWGVMLTLNVQLVNSNTKAIVVESHRRITAGGNFLKAKTPRCMNLDIADEVVEYAELVLLTFLLVWRERVGERAKSVSEFKGGPLDLTSAVLMSSR